MVVAGSQDLNSNIEVFMPAPAIVWFRQDLRVTDNPALHVACERGGADLAAWRDRLSDHRCRDA